MSVALIGLALGLTTAAADAPVNNPYVLAADRHYQELIYQHKRVFRPILRRTGRLASHAAETLPGEILNADGAANKDAGLR